MPQRKKAGKVISMPATPENQIRTRARNLTIGDCWITEDWEDMREANILVTRKHNQGGVTFGVYLIDLALFGLKDTFYQFNMSPSEFDDFLQRYNRNEESVKIDYTLAHNIIYGAIGYAEDYDFHPHKDFSVSQYILEEDSDDIPLIELEFGVDGLPTVFKSDENPRIGEIRQMERLVGTGNFQVIDLGERPDEDPDVLKDTDDLFDDAFDDDDEDDEMDPYADDEVDPNRVLDYLGGVNWKTIYEQCNQIFALKPWKKLSETNIFAIKLPGSGKEYFVSVMGAVGEIFALSFYEGERAIYKFFELQNEDVNYHPTFLLTIPHFMISWEEREDLEPIQGVILERLGIQYKGKSVWPMINQIKPGYIPGLADLKEFKNIGFLLGQCLDVLPRAISNKSFLWVDKNLNDTFLFRIPKKVRGEWEWHDEYKTPAEDLLLSKIKFHQDKLDQYKRLPVKWKSLQVDILMQPFPVREKDGTIKYHFTLIAMDPKTELIILASMLKPVKNYETIFNSLPSVFIKEMILLGGRPGKIEFRNPDLAMGAQFFEDLTETKIAFQNNLEPLGMVLISLVDELYQLKRR